LVFLQKCLVCNSEVIREKMIDKTVKIFDLAIFSKSRLELLKILQNHLRQQNGLLVIFTPNPEQIMLARRDKTFASSLGFADILVPDGFGLVLAAKMKALFLAQKALEERIAGIDLAEDLLKIAREQKLPALILGGRGYQGREVSGKLDIGGWPVEWHQAYQDVRQPLEAEEKAVVALIKNLRPSIVFVAFGAPHQEKWVVEHRELLEKSGVLLVQVVGGAFDVILGKFRRAPGWMRRLGLEWLFRLFQQPWRLKRQLQLIPFMFLTFKQVLVKQRRGRK